MSELNKTFPNVASSEHSEDLDNTLAKELEAAGIEVLRMLSPIRHPEVKTKVVGGVKWWSFERQWYYWSAKGPGIPPDIAEELHSRFGKEVRVDGHCGCPSPTEWFKGFAVGRYHIDTPEGLLALAETIKAIGAAR